MTSLSAPDPVARRTHVRRAAGFVVLLVGVLSMASVLRPGLLRRFHFLADVLPGTLVSASAAVSVAVGMLLAGLAVSLGRGRRRAWRIVLVLLGAEVVLQVTQGHHLQAAVSLVAIAVLVLARDSFAARSEPVVRSGAIKVGAALLATSVLLGWIAISVLADEEALRMTPLDRLGATVVGLVGITSPVTQPESPASDAVYYLLVAMAATTVMVTGVLLLRAPRWLPGRTAAEDARLAGLVARHSGEDSLAYFALRDDRSLVWSSNGSACISYRQVGGTLLAAGDPIGPASEWPSAIAAFLDRARSVGAVPAVAAASEASALAWSRHGRLTALEFGDEAVLDTDGFSLSGREMRNVRQAVARASRAGVSARVVRLGAMSADEVERLRVLADQWRPGHEERGFSMALGRIDAARDPDAVVVLADIGDDPQAFLLLVPWGRDGLSLDLMRRSAHAPSGVNELMISCLADVASSYGIRRISLNFAPFREAIERSERFGAGPATRLWGRLLRLASRGSQADSLYRFNAKFRPEWRRRFLVHPPAVGLPRVTWAYLSAEGMVPSLRRPAQTRPGTAPGPAGQAASLPEQRAVPPSPDVVRTPTPTTTPTTRTGGA
jgi:lysyl-tRNA synthetase class 2